MLLLLHGWTASPTCSSSRPTPRSPSTTRSSPSTTAVTAAGIRAVEPFELEDAADDAAALLEHLGAEPVIAVGYSMGGPIGMLLARRHPELVAGMVVQATALEWRATVLRAGPMEDGADARADRPLVGLSVVVALRAATHVDDATTSRAVRRVAGRRAGSQRCGRLVHAGQSLSRYDATSWASTLGLPAAMSDHHARPPGEAAQAARARRAPSMRTSWRSPAITSRRGSNADESRVTNSSSSCCSVHARRQPVGGGIVDLGRRHLDVVEPVERSARRRRSTAAGDRAGRRW